MYILNNIYIRFFLVLIMCVIYSLSNIVFAQIDESKVADLNKSVIIWDSKSCEEKNKVFMNLIEQIMIDTVFNSVHAYYKANSLYKPGIYKYRVISLSECKEGFSDEFTIVFEVKTFKGAHNPPFYTDYITYRISGHPFTIKEIDYIHTSEK